MQEVGGKEPHGGFCGIDSRGWLAYRLSRGWHGIIPLGRCEMSLGRGSRKVALVLILALAAIAAACGGATQQAVECTAGGSADQAAFAEHFSRMEFGSGGAPTGEGGQEFTPSDAVVVVVAAKTETATRLCAQERGRLGTVAYDQTHTLPVGESRLDLGAFQKKGNYVVRVSVGETLVKNLTFTVR